MNVVNRCRNRLRREQVPIEACTFLPEPKTEFPGSLLHRQFFPKPGIVVFEDFSNLLGSRLFRSSQETAHASVGGLRPNKQVDVFGHEYKGNELKTLFPAGGVQCRSKDPFKAVVCQQWPSLETRKRQLMQMHELLKTTQQFPMGFNHVFKVADSTGRACGTRLWHPACRESMEATFSGGQTWPAEGEPFPSVVTHRLENDREYGASVYRTGAFAVGCLSQVSDFLVVLLPLPKFVRIHTN